MFYLDLLPFFDAVFILTGPDVVARYFAPDHLLPRHTGLKAFVYLIMGEYNPDDLGREIWGSWRKLFILSLSTTPCAKFGFRYR